MTNKKKPESNARIVKKKKVIEVKKVKAGKVRSFDRLGGL